MEGIAGKVAIVTGAGSGIGRGTALKLAAAGCKVMLTDVAEEAGRRVAAECTGTVDFVAADLRSDDRLAVLVGATETAWGGIDFLINAACTYQDNGAAATRAEWLDAFDVNVFGHVMLLNRAVPALSRSDCASVVNFTTEAAHAGLAGRWVYPASKAAIEQVTRSQALEYAPLGIRVNSILHGWTRKPMHDVAPPEVQAAYAGWAKRLHMIGRLGTLDEAADAVMFLCSSHSRFMTGSCLQVDGGHSSLGPQGVDTILPTQLRAASCKG
ncbi:MAG TPA: SDR family oxidoreductase [Burkholderiaceae bacterium]|nr:SDR family oxidoreductase [Burkholderiaceae bacterium]